MLPPKPTRLYRKIVLPVTAAIAAIIALFTILATSIIISFQNDQTRKSVDRSMNYLYRSLWYQFNSLKNISGIVISSQEIENVLEGSYANKADAVSDYYRLFSEFQNLSLMSFLNEIDPYSQAQISYSIMMVVDQTSGLYDLATDHYATVNGIYKNDDVKLRDWYKELIDSDNSAVWWTESDGARRYIYNAKQKKSIKNGNALGVVVIGYAVNNLQGIIQRGGLPGGSYLLTDEKNHVVYSDRYPFQYDASQSTDLRKTMEDEQGLYSLSDRGAKRIVAYDRFDNGWKLIAVVPENRFRAAAPVAGIALVVGLAGMAITGYLIRRTTAKATGPITKLARTMKRVELGELSGAEREELTYIEEIDLLNRGYRLMLERLQALIEEVYVKDITQKQLQLDLLQAQINPHFLYNTLDMINCKALSIGDEEISAISRSLANVLRLGLNKGQQVIPLKDELKQVSSYLDIQKLMHDSLSYEIDMDEKLAERSIIHFILQPLVENSIVHGFRSMRNDQRIRIRAEAADPDLILEIWDNGSGVDADTMNRMLAGTEPEGEKREYEGGFGTRNVDRRIKLRYGDDYGITYQIVDEGTCAVIRLPLYPS
ncbi:sensor histidine kinase [Gorillibacterium massiliense]|uniref:sensor histidine kinase n=1 Tax=Gorillibacterium massiliense TaxID=1280390 RepID=UPI0004B60767|nr:sensor histidine kinase [Gorillibacterium massiliense]